MRDRNEEKRIVSFFVPKVRVSDDPITDSISQVADEFDLDSIRAHLVEKLPHYAVPSSEF